MSKNVSLRHKHSSHLLFLDEFSVINANIAAIFKQQELADDQEVIS